MDTKLQLFLYMYLIKLNTRTPSEDKLKVNRSNREIVPYKEIHFFIYNTQKLIYHNQQKETK